MPHKTILQKHLRVQVLPGRSLIWRLALVGCLLLGLEISQAQVNTAVARPDSIRFGLQVGLGFSHFTGWGFNGYDPTGENLVRFRGGGNVDIPLRPGLSIRPELLLSWKGYKTSDSVSYKTELMYLNTPVDVVIKLLNLTRNPNRKADLNLGVGVYGGIALHGKFEQDSSATHVVFNNHEVPSTATNYGAYYKRYDAGLNFFLEFTGNSFYSQFGATVGLVNIKPPLQNSTARQANYRNTSIDLTYGWRF
jgi:Outer membrane protein beta-barrel domain